MDPIPENLFGDRIQSSVFYSLDGIQALVPNSLWIIDRIIVEIYLDHDVLFKSLIFWELFALSFR